MGVDPGLACTGWGTIRWQTGQSEYIQSGLIKTTPKDSQIERLAIIGRAIQTVLQEESPALICIERVFININLKNSLELGEARGALIANLLQGSAPVTELTALQIKKTVTGLGRASKQQVARMVYSTLSLLDQNFAPDCTDALACAIAAGAALRTSPLQQNNLQNIEGFRGRGRGQGRRYTRRKR